MAQDEMQLMRQLVDELNRASNSYYSGLGERMTDYEWDAKFDELKQLEQKTGVALPDSPSFRHCHWPRPNSRKTS